MSPYRRQKTPPRGHCGTRYTSWTGTCREKRRSEEEKSGTVLCERGHPLHLGEDGIPEEDSLAENCQRVALHPLDQFRAFRSLQDQGLSEDDIAARFFVTPQVVKQRLKLASVSPKLLDAYAADEMTLEQLMCFTISGDHARQEQVWETVLRGYNQESLDGRCVPIMVLRCGHNNV
jgi:hypothetical protein